MALQLNSGTYGLRQVSSPNKTVLLMKLTDTALRILENYQDRSSNTRLQPCIQFRGTQGVIQIPVPSGSRSGENEPEYQSFTFQVSNLTQSAGVDCLQQIRSGHTGHIDCLGSVQQKVTVNATDDSFNMTRNRMTLAKEEEQKISTKVIKQPSGSKLGKFAKRNQKHLRFVEKQHHSSSSKLSPDSRVSTPPLSRPTPTTLLSSNRSSSPLINFNKDSTSSPPGGHGTVRNKTKPSMSISSSSTTSSFQPSQQLQSSAVASRPLWDRVAHLLIIRPYKYPEIVLRLTRDGAPDKSRLQTLLQQIASPRNTPNGNTEYCLQRNFYNKLDIDWPGYTESEKKIVKKKLAEANRATTESRKRAFNPGSTSPNSKDSVENGDSQTYLNPTSKKQRVSHYKKPSPAWTGTGPSGGGTSPMETETATSKSPVPAPSGISFGTTRLPTRDSSPIVGGQDGQAKKQQRGSGTDVEDPSKVVEKIPQDSQNSKNNKTNNSNKLSQEKHEKPTENKESENVKKDYNCDEDFILKYPPISNSAQRDRYKSDFYAEYQEYLCHHEKVAAVSERFAKLQVKLNCHRKGSEEYKAISRVVVQEYRKIKKNQVYHQEKARMQFLHRKLQHIKHLVNDYDKRRLTNRAAENDPGLCMQTKTATRVA